MLDLMRVVCDMAMLTLLVLTVLGSVLTYIVFHRLASIEARIDDIVVTLAERDRKRVQQKNS